MSFFESISRTLYIDEKKLSTVGGDTHHFDPSLKDIDGLRAREEFYSMKEDDNRIDVRNGKGQLIIYDCALVQLKAIEVELISLGSYFINSLLSKGGGQTSGDYTKDSTSIDYYGILVDLFSCEYEYQRYVH